MVGLYGIGTGRSDDTPTMNKRRALLKHLQEKGLPVEIGNVRDRTDEIFVCRGKGYTVLSLHEAKDAVKPLVLDRVYQAPPALILKFAQVSEYDRTDALPVVGQIQEQFGPAANGVLKAMLKDVDGFVEEALPHFGGRGGLLNPTDGTETTVILENRMYFIYTRTWVPAAPPGSKPD